ncbi:RDD family protein [Legionella erythra]|uniref:RDD family protein n=1 Tax=Legionella erythra TaxID=448 RepID=A0A0W0TFN3_LEGER|nr:RDD family protein [Legionella erythra]KTC94386.1 RDD family protein [Legionella erythra]
MYLRLLAALFYDLIILCSLFMLATAIAVYFNQGQAIPPGSRTYQSLLVAIMAVYFTLSFRYGGQTIGFKSWRLRLVRAGSVKFRLVNVA